MRRIYLSADGVYVPVLYTHSTIIILLARIGSVQVPTHSERDTRTTADMILCRRRFHRGPREEETVVAES